MSIEDLKHWLLILHEWQLEIPLFAKYLIFGFAYVHARDKIKKAEELSVEIENSMKRFAIAAVQLHQANWETTYRRSHPRGFNNAGQFRHNKYTKEYWMHLDYLAKKWTDRHTLEMGGGRRV